MKSSATDIAWERNSEDITAQIIAKRIKRETQLREIVEQSAFDFLIGDSLFSRTLRIVGLLAIVGLYFFSEAISLLGVWPVFMLGAFVEAYRANRRLDALLELERIAKECSES